MPDNLVTAAFAAECERLTVVAADLPDAELGRPSPCPPWSVGEVLSHVVVAVRRIGQATAGPDSGQGELVATADYYRPDQRFSAGANSDRIDTAVALAHELGGAAAIAAAFDAAWRAGHSILVGAPAEAIVRTRHGDRMLLTDFATTRVVEVAVHGLDLAVGLGRTPWLTKQAAEVVEDLLAPGSAESLRVALGCDQVGLIARLTGRAPLSAEQAAMVREHGITRLALG